jgi:hypothetical protein
MSYSPANLRAHVAAYLAGATPIASLDQVLAWIGEDAAAGEDKLFAWAELLMAEFTNGHLTEDELVSELAKLAPVPIVEPQDPYFRQTRGSSTSPTTSLSLTDVIGRPLEVGEPLAVGTRFVAAPGSV